MFEIGLKIPAIDLARTFETKVQSIIEDEAIALADQLQQESPVGATGELKGGWDVRVSRLSVTVLNTSDAALFRIRGRGPGKFPPFGEGSPLARWAALKGIPPFLVARSIARKGTKRWRDKSNFAGIDYDGKPVAGGAIDRATKRIAQRLRTEVIR